MKNSPHNKRTAPLGQASPVLQRIELQASNMIVATPNDPRVPTEILIEDALKVLLRIKHPPKAKVRWLMVHLDLSLRAFTLPLGIDTLAARVGRVETARARLKQLEDWLVTYKVNDPEAVNYIRRVLNELESRTVRIQPKPCSADDLRL